VDISKARTLRFSRGTSHYNKGQSITNILRIRSAISKQSFLNKCYPYTPQYLPLLTIMTSEFNPPSPVSLPNEPPFPEDENHLVLRTEFMENYGPGLLCPVHLGDLFKGARYQILRKLGYGVYSTVWLAIDREQGSIHPYTSLGC